MIDSDELLSKADALLARWRTGGAAPRPPDDYPVLTEVVDVPETAREAVETSFESPEAAPAEVYVPPAGPVPPGAVEESKGPEELQEPEQTAQDAAALEERLRARVLEAIEPHIGTFLEEPLRLRLEDLARRLAADLAQDARNDILNFLREAVQRAVAQELESQRDERPDSRR